MLNPIIKDAENYHISNLDYLNLFLIHETVSVKNLWKHLYGLAKDQIHETHHESIETILNEGTLATRILKAVGTDFTEAKIKNVYSRLADCLQKNTVFLP